MPVQDSAVAVMHQGDLPGLPELPGLPGLPGPAAGSFGAEVLSKLGHELRSPLAAIIGLTKVMLMRLSAGTADAATQASN